MNAKVVLWVVAFGASVLVFEPLLLADLPLPPFQLNLSETKQLKVDNQGYPYPPEITPMVITQPNGKRLYVLSTAWSFLCESSDNLLASSPASPLRLSAQDCKLITQEVILDHVEANGSAVFRPRQQISDAEWTQDWRRTYDGILGIHLVGDRLLALRHGEHANARFSGYDYQGDIVPACQIDNCCICNPNGCYTESPNCTSMADCQWHCCFSGYNNGTYYQCWESFGSFASLAWAPYNQAAGWQHEDWVDEGPVYWPDTPYLVNGQRSGDGPYHTTSLVHEDYLYLFTIDMREEGGAQCAVAARAPLSGLALPGSWKSYSNGSFLQDSLPFGFSRETLRNSYSQAGGSAECIFKDDLQNAFIWFNVARIVGTPYFIGAEESSPNYSTWQMGVRIATDLVHWSPLQILSSSTGPWGTGWYSYPTFYDRLGSGNADIDPWDFYILGTHATNAAGYELNALRLGFACDSLAAPAGLSPDGEVFAGNVAIQWTPRTGVAFYSIRIDDLADGWNYLGSCQEQSPMDFCVDEVLDHTFSFPAQAGHAYDFWVHERNLCGQWGEASRGHVEVAADADDGAIVADAASEPDGGPNAESHPDNGTAEPEASFEQTTVPDEPSKEETAILEITPEDEIRDGGQVPDESAQTEPEATGEDSPAEISGSCHCASPQEGCGLVCWGCLMVLVLRVMTRKRRG